MKKAILIGLLIGVTLISLNADTIISINYGSNYSSYTNQDLKRRVWELERAVVQLQQSIFSGKVGSISLSWVCTIMTQGEVYKDSGLSKEEAKMNVIDKCTKQRKDAFFCNSPRCKQ